MTVRELVADMGLTVRAGSVGLDRGVSGGYASDLLSDVMANAREGNVWITLHKHPNVMAVAVNGGLAAVVLVNGREPEEATRQKADEEGVPLLVSALPAFELVGRMHRAGIPGQSRD